jgi:hypothetical protein
MVYKLLFPIVHEYAPERKLFYIGNPPQCVLYAQYNPKNEKKLAKNYYSSPHCCGLKVR